MKKLSSKELRQVNGGDDANANTWVGRIGGKIAGGVKDVAHGAAEALK